MEQLNKNLQELAELESHKSERKLAFEMIKKQMATIEELSSDMQEAINNETTDNSVLQEKRTLEGYYNTLQQMKNQLRKDMKSYGLDNDDYGCSSLEETCDKLREEHATLEGKFLTAKENIKLARASRVRKISEMEEVIKTEKLTEDRKKHLQLNISEAEDTRKERLNTILELKGNIRVFCRVRPLLEGEELAEISYPDSAEFAGREINLKINGKELKYTFDKVFRPESTQSDIFGEVSQLIQSSLDGKTVSLFSYGQTGSGKTYTLMGDTNFEEKKGIIPRALEMLFCNLESKGMESHVNVSALEIYEDRLYDLLLDPKEIKKSRGVTESNVKIRHVGSKAAGQGDDVTKEVFTVNGLMTKEVFTAKDASKLLNKAARNRSTSATEMNKTSSRSHMIFRLDICSTHEAMENAHGALYLIDLAGSERLEKSQAAGDRRIETGFINKSLTELGMVIRAIIAGDDVIYRKSKLIQVLQPCLGGNSKTLMIVNISPARSSWHESMESLNFAQDVNRTICAASDRTGLR